MQFLKKTSKNKCEQKDIYLVLLPMILGMCLCATCLIGGTFAWFSASQSTGTADLKTAEYAVDISVGGVSYQTDEEYTLNQGKYTVTLTARGDATTGYCTITLGNSQKWILQFPSEKYSQPTLTFDLIMNESATVMFTSSWGTSVVNHTDAITASGSITYGIAPETQTTAEETEPNAAINPDPIDEVPTVTESSEATAANSESSVVTVETSQPTEIEG